MEHLFTMDMKNYNAAFPRYRRPSVRGIIICGGKVAMVYSRKYDYYKFPGGGIESGEDHITALTREVQEETGLIVDTNTIREFGSVLRIQLSEYSPQTIFEQENFYYLCDVTDKAAAQKLDDYESDEGFTLQYVTPQEAINVNRSKDHSDYDAALIEREARVLECIIERGLV